MVNLLIGNKNTKEVDILCHKLTNDENFKIEHTITGIDTVSAYWNLTPDILVLDSNLTDMSIPDIVDRLSASPIEQKRCNTILTVPKNHTIKLHNVTKINSIIYKPILNNELVDKIKIMSIDYNTPDLEAGEIDWLLQSLNFNCLSMGYKYMKDAIIYCYYRPDQLEFLTNVLKYIAYKNKIPESRVRDCLKSSIRPLNHTSLSQTHELYKVLYNNGHSISLKDFLERLVFYLIKIKKKGRLF